MENLFFVAAIVSTIWGIISMMVMVSFCSERGVKINWMLIRLFVLSYVSRYREITIKENGKPGFWYYSFIVAINAALGFGIFGWVLQY